MTSASSHDQNEVPIIWLLPPDAHHFSSGPFRPIPIAISAALVALVFVALVILYNLKSGITRVARTSMELENLKASIRVIRPASTEPPSSPCQEHSPPRPQIETRSETIDEPRVEKYHNALKDIHNAPCTSSFKRTSSKPTIDSYYYSSTAIADGKVKHEIKSELPVARPVSSDYSVSICPTPLPSRRNSSRNKEINGGWKLRQGSEYDRDRHSRT